MISSPAQISQRVSILRLGRRPTIGVTITAMPDAGLGLELVDQVDSGKETHRGAVAHAIGADCYGDMALAGAGRSSGILPGVRRLKFGSSIHFTRTAVRP